MWGSNFHLNPRAMEPQWLSAVSPQTSWSPCLSYACGCFHVQVLCLSYEGLLPTLPKEPFPLSWIHFFSAPSTRGKCQAGSCPAFIWLWPRPLLSLRVCSPKSYGYHTPANKPPKASIQNSPTHLRYLTPKLCFPSQRLGSCSLIFF